MAKTNAYVIETEINIDFLLYAVVLNAPAKNGRLNSDTLAIFKNKKEAETYYTKKENAGFRVSIEKITCQ